MELLIILALAFAAMWFMSRKSRLQQKAAADFRANLAPGQQVMTGSGLFATIVSVEDDVVTLEASPGVETRWLRPAIAKLVEPPVAQDDELDEDEDLYEDDELEGDELEDDELEDDELEDDLAPTDDDAADDDTTVDVPDDASSLTTDRDEGDTPRR